MNETKKEVTIYDLAAKLNISVATVSRALRDDPVVNVKTKKRVFELAEEFGYQVNHFARNLRKQKTNTIGVVVPRLNSYFMSTVIAGIEQVANAAGYNLVISQSSESLEREKAVVRTMFHNRVDGLLVSLSYHSDVFDHFDLFAQKNIPVIFFDRTYDTALFPSIRINNQQAGYQATRYLLDIGRRKIAHITVSSSHSIYQERYQGYVQALGEHGLSPEPELLYHCDLGMEAGAAAANHFLNLNQIPDGIFVANDTCAAGCLVELKKAGLRIPEDVAIIGFNDDPVCRIVEPHLSSIHYPGHDMGELAARNLIDQLSGAADIQSSQGVLLRSELKIRESTLKG